jgi:hypothetical protein
MNERMHVPIAQPQAKQIPQSGFVLRGLSNA